MFVTILNFFKIGVVLMPFGYGYGTHGYGYGGHHYGHHGTSGFALIVVLFILLIIIGASYAGYGY